MKVLVVNRNIILVIFVVMLLIYGGQGISYGQGEAPTVEPGENDTSLIVSFSDFFERREQKAHQVQFRRKSPQGEWITICQSKTNTERRSCGLFFFCDAPATLTISAIFTDLEPGITYEARYRDTNQSECVENPLSPDPWSSIGEGTTSYTGLSISTASPLTEATLGEGVVTLTLSYDTYEADVDTIMNAVTVTGIDGVTVDTASVQRLSDTEITVELNYDNTDFDVDTALTFSLDSDAITDYTGDAFTVEITVTAIIELVSASVVSPLTEATLDGSIVTLNLTGEIYEQDISKIRDAVTVTGVDDVTVDTASVQRLSDGEITVGLDFDRTDFDTDTALTFSVGAGAIADYTGDAFTSEILVTAIKEVISASVVSPLTEATLDESIVTLLLTGAAYEQDISKIKEAVAISGINGVTVDTDTMQRLSDRRVTVKLDYDGTDFDTDTPLTFSLASEAIANHNGELSTKLPVTAIVEAVDASVVSPLTKGTLDGSIVTLNLTGLVYEQDISKIREAVTVSGINGVTVDTATLQRLGDRVVAVELDFDGTDFVLATALTFSVVAGAITNYDSTALTTEIYVSANRGEAQLTIFWTDSGTDKIQRANFDGSNVQDLVTQGLNIPSGIALDVAGGKMYWTDWDTRKIQRANLDGSNIQDLVTQELGSPGRIVLDVEGGKMYWTDYSIRRANFDGSDVQNLVIQGLRNPSGIALDVAGGKMYWINNSYTVKIQRANFDGSNVQDLVTQGLDRPRDIALDVAGGKMYWTDSGTERIQRANLDGSNVQDLVTQGLSRPGGIALDIARGKMYWTDSDTDKIQRANLDGSNIEDLVTQRYSSPRGIAIGIISLVNPTTETEAPTITKEDVNGDGVVDVNDLVIVAQQYGKTGDNDADVNGDEIVNVDDFILVAAAVDSAAAAPAARAQVQSHFTKAQLQGWLTEARASGNTSHTYQRGIAVLERLLALFTPEETALLANYPNPFNPETWIPYQLSKPADVTLTIYDIRGHVVRALDLGHQRAGMYQTRSRAAYWDGRNAFGEPVASGVYFYTLTAGDFTATRKMLIRK